MSQVVPREGATVSGIIKVANQIFNSDFQRVRNVHQTRKAHTIEAELIFLNLLKSQTDCGGKRRL